LANLVDFRFKGSNRYARTVLRILRSILEKGNYVESRLASPSLFLKTYVNYVTKSMHTDFIYVNRRCKATRYVKEIAIPKIGIGVEFSCD
jgi:hypothetical protein